jgi:superfamily II DNA or RNA helicase
MFRVIVDNLYSRLEGDVDATVLYHIGKRLTYRLKDAYYVAGAVNRRRFEAYGTKPGEAGSPDAWDGTVSLFWPETKQFYTGMMSEVLAVLDEAKLSYDIVDFRIAPEKNLPHLKFSPPSFIEPREYQDWSVKRCLAATRGILQAATGAGKTLMVTQLIGEIQTAPFLFLVLSIDLMDQAVDTLTQCLNVPIGRVGCGYCDIQGINVMTIQTAVRALNRNNPKFDITNFAFDEEDAWDDGGEDVVSKNGAAIEALVRSAKGIYVDECHHVASTTCKEVLFAAKNAYWRFGGSATPYREDGAEKMIQALFGRPLVNISASVLIQNKFLVKPYIFNVKIKDGAAGHYHAYKKVYNECIVNNAKLNELTAQLIRFFAERNITSLTLVQQYEHGYKIQEFLPDLPFIKGNMAKKGRKVGIQDLRDGKTIAAIATSLADEGLDVKRLGAVIVAGGGKSITRIYQRIGRVLRPFPGKNFAFAIVFSHDGKHLKKHGARVKNILKQEPEFCVIDSTPEDIFDDISKVLGEDTINIFGETDGK